MGQALYRKHRPKKLDEVVGQEHITTTLSRALKSGRISHAYLLVGPRGVGKTSIARILAHEINNLPYTDDSVHFDIIEIDAASNRRIDEIRDLRDKVHIAPTSAKYKVYIIDEVHMLTKEAFNALLKTLEEPPAHVVFILATTEAHKLPETIVSRTQRFTFRPIDQRNVVAHLKVIAKEEGIKVSDEALGLIAAHGDGSFRDSISLLDQAANQGGAVQLADIEVLLGIPPEQAIDNLMATLEGTSVTALMTQLADLYTQGYQPTVIAKKLAERLRKDLLSPEPRLPSEQTLALLRRLIEVPASGYPERLLEIILLEALPQPAPSSPDKPTKPSAPPPSSTSEIKPTEPKLPKQPPKPKAQAAKAKPAVQSVPTAALDMTVWPQVIDALKRQYNTLYGIVRNAQVAFPESGVVQLTFGFAFHQKRISDAKNAKILTDIIYSLTGHAVQLRCLYDKNATPAPAAVSVSEPEPAMALPPDGAFSAISNIFGGGELLES